VIPRDSHVRFQLEVSCSVRLPVLFISRVHLPNATNKAKAAVPDPPRSATPRYWTAQAQLKHLPIYSA
jgi:hypothetical protein